MARIALLVPSLRPADGVSTDVIEMYRVLERHGHDVRLFCPDAQIPTIKVWPPSELDRYLRNPSDILLYHFSMFWNIAPPLLASTKYRTVVKYHNVTPPEFFSGLSQDYQQECHRGRQQIQEIARTGCDLYLADSDFNRRELVSYGADESNCFALAPFHRIDCATSVEADFSVLDSYRDGATNVLTVGRVAPNKGHIVLLEAFAAYHHYYNRYSRLLIVGKETERLEAYSTLLRDFISYLRLQEAVVLTGEVSEEALKAYYLVSHVFVLTSQHEGFCVPLVEAMAVKLPIVALDSTAVGGTVNNAALLWKDNDPWLLAESVHRLVSDEEAAAELGLAGWSRYRCRFTHEKIESEFLRLLSRVAT